MLLGKAHLWVLTLLHLLYCYWRFCVLLGNLHASLLQSSERRDRILDQVSFAESREVGEWQDFIKIDNSKMSLKILLHAQYYDVHTLGYRKWPSRPLKVPVGPKLPQYTLVGFCRPKRTNFGRSVPVGYFSCCCTFRTSSRPHKK